MPIPMLIPRMLWLQLPSKLLLLGRLWLQLPSNLLLLVRQFFFHLENLQEHVGGLVWSETQLNYLPSMPSSITQQFQVHCIIDRHHTHIFDMNNMDVGNQQPWFSCIYYKVFCCIDVSLSISFRTFSLMSDRYRMFFRRLWLLMQISNKLQKYQQWHLD